MRAERLIEQVRERIRYLHYSLRTEEAYVHWARAYVRFHGCTRHPAEMGAPEVEAFLTWLANERHVSIDTHQQALSALVFLYGKVLGVELPWLDEIGRPKPRVRLPEVLTQSEVARLLTLFDPGHLLFARLLYGTGLRVMEALRLRVKDVDFQRRAIVVREGKGAKDRVVMLPAALVPALPKQHADVSTTMIYTHVLKLGGVAVRSPLDALLPAGADRSSAVPTSSTGIASRTSADVHDKSAPSVFLPA